VSRRLASAIGSHDDQDADAERLPVERRLWITAALAVVGVVVLYLVFVQTHWGQEFDDAAFEGRRVAQPELTAETDRLLHSVTRVSLVFLGGALVLIALGRRRVRLAIVVAAALGGSLLTSEALKTVLDRPLMSDIAGVTGNSFPSGHATIGMSLSLGLMFVVARRWRWLAAIIAVVVATLFGTGVLTSGWHRPSDSLAAYLVSLAWFSAGAAVLVAWRGPGRPAEDDELESHLGRYVMAAVFVLLTITLVVGLVLTLQADGLRTVEYSGQYVFMCIVIDVAGVGIVALMYQLLRGVSLDPPQHH
jgi:membrane-associated phospholipid phosphatase